MHSLNNLLPTLMQYKLNILHCSTMLAFKQQKLPKTKDRTGQEYTILKSGLTLA